MSFLLSFDDPIQPYESAKLVLIADECWTFFSRALLMQEQQHRWKVCLSCDLYRIHISFSWGLFFSFPVWNSLNICQKYNFFILKTSPAQMRKTQQIAFHKNKLSNTISSFLVSQCNIVKSNLAWHCSSELCIHESRNINYIIILVCPIILFRHF